MRIPLLGTSKIEWTAIYLWYSRGIFLSTFPFKEILIKCFLVPLSYIKIAQGNITLDRISIPISWASQEMCEVWQIYLECENCTFTFIYCIFRLHFNVLAYSSETSSFFQKGEWLALIDEFTLPVNKYAVEKRCQQMFECCV